MIPIFDYIIYPALRRWGINFSPIKRIYAGFLVAGLAMLYAAILEHYLYKMSPCHDNQPSACLDANNTPMPANVNVWVVSGPYILVGLSEIFVRFLLDGQVHRILISAAGIHHLARVRVHEGTQAHEISRHGVLSIPECYIICPELCTHCGEH